MKSKLDADVLNGASNLAKLRGNCNAVRTEQSAASIYTKRRKHENCGFYADMHLSSLTIGQTVRRMQKELRDLLFGSLLFGNALPPDIEEDFAGLCGNLQKERLAIGPCLI